jgi:deoxyribodipyrimidine photo-lyase
MKALLWYRNDLRMQDHPAVHEAATMGYELLPIYLYEDSYETELPYQLGEPSCYQKKFLIESIEELNNSWKQLGAELLILRGSAEQIIPMLCTKYGISIVMASKEYAPNEIKTEMKLADALQKTSVSFKLFHSSLLINPEELPFSVEKLPDIFTIFRKEVEAKTKFLPPLSSTSSVHILKHQETSITLEYSGETKKYSIYFTGGELKGHERIQQYLWESNLVSSYKETRNGMLGMDYSTKFSPWLALGCISPRQILAELKRYEKERISNESTYWVVFELLWRDYFKFVMMKYGRTLFLKNGTKKAKSTISLNLQKFELWREGKTGNDFINANMLELKNTGFMSNRGRQNVASYLVHDLQVDWRLGAAYFEQMLIDYDVCSNWGNWAYVAGVGNDPRENRKFNPERQAQMYDPNEEFVKTWLRK